MRMVNLVPLERLPLGTAMAAYPLRTVLESADLLNLVNAPPVLRIAADYLGCKPTLSSLGVQMVLSKPRAAAGNAAIPP